jgi:hypothetical protein
MDIHKNARLTLRRREDLVQHVAGGVTLKLGAPPLQPHTEYPRQLDTSLSPSGSAWVVGSFFSPSAQSTPNFVLAGGGSDRPAAPALSRLSDRPRHQLSAATVSRIL